MRWSHPRSFPSLFVVAVLRFLNRGWAWMTCLTSHKRDFSPPSKILQEFHDRGDSESVRHPVGLIRVTGRS